MRITRLRIQEIFLSYINSDTGKVSKLKLFMLIGLRQEQAFRSIVQQL